MKRLLFLCVITIHSAFAQPGHETMPASTLPEQAWWDLLHYTINIRPDLTGRSISGTSRTLHVNSNFYVTTREGQPE